MDWKAFFDKLGMNGTHWQWKIIRWERWWKSRFTGSRTDQPQISTQHKFCQDCGALLERHDAECIRCGAKAQSWHGQAARRKLAFALPSACPVSGLILFLIILIAALRLAPAWDRSLGYAGAYYRGSGEWWRIISYAYLHGGLMHLAFNGLALSQLGPLVEKQIGSSRAFVVYTFTAVTAVFGFYLTGGQALVGASGSLFGLIGFGLSFNHFDGGGQAKMMRGFYLQWAVYGILFGLLAGAGLRIANSAHMGGLVGGLVLGFLIERDLRRPDRFVGTWKFLELLCWGGTFFALVKITWTALV